MKIAQVYIEHPIFTTDKPFSYYISESQSVLKGTRVEVSFNGQKLTGYVENIIQVDQERKDYEEENGFELKEIDRVVDKEPILNDELVSLAHSLAKQNVAPLIACYQSILPPSLKPVTSNKITEKYAKALKLVRYDTSSLTNKQILVLDLIKEKDVLLRDISDKYSVKKLLNLGLVEQFEKELYRNPYNEVYERVCKPVLTNDQKKVLDEINSSNDRTFLLEGVTGSGKTEIYLRLAEQALEEGKNVLVIIPEISLTPQTVKRFKERLDYPIAVLHSQLTSGEKYDEYRRIRRKEARIVIGARSAIFAPLTDIGLIIIDEEHSDTYKESDNSPCYYLHDIALERANTHNCKVILGSATPSLESKTRALKSIYHLVNLPKRVNELPLPEVSIVDMRKEVKNGNYSILSRELKEAIKETLEKKQQVILLLNRRGYSKSMYCANCGNVFKCPTCNMPLHYHINDDKLKCHYCGLTFDKPTFCPKCGSKFIRNVGAGTQKLEEVIHQEFTGASVLRMDLDSIMKKGELAKFLNDFATHQYDIMLGTQIISKGLDFPNVGLVGVVDADSSLNNGNFRSNERTFQLLTQVVGRSGRGSFKGKAIIQTNNPTSYAITYAAAQDYESFFKQEMGYRKMLQYPPYKFVASITFSYSNKDKLYRYVDGLKSKIKEISIDPKLVVLGPSEPKLSHIGNTYKLRLIIKYSDKSSILEVLNYIKELVVSNNISVKFDTSPQEID